MVVVDALNRLLNA